MFQTYQSNKSLKDNPEKEEGIEINLQTTQLLNRMWHINPGGGTEIQDKMKDKNPEQNVKTEEAGDLIMAFKKLLDNSLTLKTIPL